MEIMSWEFGKEHEPGQGGKNHGGTYNLGVIQVGWKNGTCDDEQYPEKSAGADCGNHKCLSLNIRTSFSM